MKDLSSILQRITKALGKDKHIKSAVINCIKEVVGFDIKDDDIDLRDGVLVITATPAKNSAIHFKEKEITSSVKERCGADIIRFIYR